MEAVLVLVLLVVLIVVATVTPLVFLLEMFGWAWTSVPYVPVPTSALKKLPEVVNLTENSVLYDLGCGDARVLYTLAETSAAQFYGVEKAPLPYVFAKVRGWFARKKNVTILYKDIMEVPLGNATHIYTYLLSKVMDALLPKFEKELKPGTVLISCDFKFKNREPNRSVDMFEGKTKHTLYFYDF